MKEFTVKAEIIDYWVDLKLKKCYVVVLINNEKLIFMERELEC